MTKSMNILSLLLVNALVLLGGCTPEKELPPITGGNYQKPKPPVFEEPDIPEGSSVLVFEGNANPVACGKNLVKRFIEIPNSNWGRTDSGKSPSSFVTYPDVCAYLGCFWFLEAAIDNAAINEDDEARADAVRLMQGLVDKYDDVIKGRTTYGSGSNKKPLVTDLLWRDEDNRVDYYIFGAISLHIASIMDNPEYAGVTWRQTKQEYMDFGLQYADNQWKFGDINFFNSRFNSSQYNKKGNLFTISQNTYNSWKRYADQGYSWQTRLWIDDMFMITALQIQAYQATKENASYNQDEADSWWKGKTNNENRYLDRAVREMKLYIEDLQGADGLYYHSPSAKHFWARGNGWMAVGMPEMLKIIEDNPSYSSEAVLLREEYEAMMSSLLRYQQSTGMWAQLINKTDLWSETSGTAMFAYAFITGVLKGWLPEDTYGVAARAAWLALMTYLEPDYDIREVCEGTGTSSNEQHYRDRKRYTGDTHGQAGMLWCAYALTQIQNEVQSNTNNHKQ